MDKFLADPQRARLGTKNALGYATGFRLLCEVAGPQRPLVLVSREHAKRIAEVLRDLPPNATKRFPGQALISVATLAKARGVAGLQAATAENILRNLSCFFEWAVAEKYARENPMKRLRALQAPRRKRDSRTPFSDDALVKIFSAPLFGAERNATEAVSPSRFWVPLIALYHGARCGEICQLEAADVVTLHGIPTLRITPDSESGTAKNLKTAHSERDVPVHPKLIELGFLDFVERQRGAGKALLFPDVKVAATGYRSDIYQKWFSRFRRKCGVDAPLLGIHSFRHNFRDAARAANIPTDIVTALGGWAGDGAVHETYGSGYTISRKRDEIAKIHYPSVEAILFPRVDL